jgi:hypothetical protein
MAALTKKELIKMAESFGIDTNLPYNDLVKAVSSARRRTSNATTASTQHPKVSTSRYKTNSWENRAYIQNDELKQPQQLTREINWQKSLMGSFELEQGYDYDVKDAQIEDITFADNDSNNMAMKSWISKKRTRPLRVRYDIPRVSVARYYDPAHPFIICKLGNRHGYDGMQVAYAFMDHMDILKKYDSYGRNKGSTGYLTPNCPIYKIEDVQSAMKEVHKQWELENQQ